MNFKKTVAFLLAAQMLLVSAASCGNASGGKREFVAPLAYGAAAIGIDVLFCEVHPRPEQAFSDGPNSLDFAMIKTVLQRVKQIHDLQ